MSELRQKFYSLLLHKRLTEARHEAFQGFFNQLMHKIHGADFIPVRPWGQQGDQRNDGYLEATQTVHQCYAPDEIEANRTIRKINEDFYGAAQHWKGKIKRWVFVYNARNGLGPEVLKALLDLKDNADGILIERMGPEELERIVLGLPDEALCDLLGPIPAERDFLALGFEELKDVLVHIQLAGTPGAENIRPVPPGKVEHNRLGDVVSDLLRLGMTRVDLVRRYFANYSDPSLADRIAARLKREYQYFRDLDCAPDDIFFQLTSFVGGGRRGPPIREAAVYSVMAYFFERCDIFQEPPERVA